MKRWIAIPLIVAISSLAMAQDAETKKLDFLLGEWESKETVHQTPTSTFEFNLKGSNKWSLENKAIVMDEQFEAMGQKVANHIIVRFNATTKKYRMWWFSNSSPEPIVFTGEFQAEKKLVFVSEPQTAGFAKQPHRITYLIGESGKYDATLEVQYGEKWTLLTEAKYTRTKAL